MDPYALETIVGPHRSRLFLINSILKDLPATIGPVVRNKARESKALQQSD